MGIKDYVAKFEGETLGDLPTINQTYQCFIPPTYTYYSL